MNSKLTSIREYFICCNNQAMQFIIDILQTAFLSIYFCICFGKIKSRIMEYNNYGKRPT